MCVQDGIAWGWKSLFVGWWEWNGNEVRLGGDGIETIQERVRMEMKSAGSGVDGYNSLT